MTCLGIIAGGGGLPQKLIKACQRDGRNFFVLALQGQTDGKILKDVPHAWVRLGATEESIRILKTKNVDVLVMAG